MTRPKATARPEPGQNKGSSEGWGPVLGLFGRLANIGFFVAAALLVGMFLGATADSFLGTRPTGSLVGLLAGLAAGAREFYRIFAAADDIDQREQLTKQTDEEH